MACHHPRSVTVCLGQQPESHPHVIYTQNETGNTMLLDNVFPYPRRKSTCDFIAMKTFYNVFNLKRRDSETREWQQHLSTASIVARILVNISSQ